MDIKNYINTLKQNNLDLAKKYAKQIKLMEVLMKVIVLF
jgi:hypothetical protein